MDTEERLEVGDVRHDGQFMEELKYAMENRRDVHKQKLVAKRKTGAGRILAKTQQEGGGECGGGHVRSLLAVITLIQVLERSTDSHIHIYTLSIHLTHSLPFLHFSSSATDITCL